MFGKAITISIIAALAAGLIALALDLPPTTKELDRDILDLHTKISDAKKQSALYQGGLIKSLIEVRVEILSSTEAMLMAKRSSILRRVNLSFRIDGSEFKSKANLGGIRTDIDAAQKRAAKAKSEAAKYSGGLLKVLELGKVASEELSIAELNSAFYSAKYGLPTIGVFMSKVNSAKQNSVPAINIVKDNDAL